MQNCDYFSKRECNYNHHKKPLLRQLICAEVGNVNIPKPLGKCGKRLKSRKELSIHLKECLLIVKQELKVVYLERPQCSKIEEINLSLQPI